MPHPVYLRKKIGCSVHKTIHLKLLLKMFGFHLVYCGRKSHQLCKKDS